MWLILMLRLDLKNIYKIVERIALTLTNDDWRRFKNKAKDLSISMVHENNLKFKLVEHE